MKNSNKKRNYAALRAAYISVASAVSVVIMLIGAFLEIADLACAMAVSFLVWFIGIEFGISDSILCYGVISVSSFLLLPSKLPVFYFVLLYGWYPSIKLILHKKIKIEYIRLIIKSVIILVCVILEEFLARSLLGYVQTKQLTAIIVIVSIIIYIPYDMLLSKLAVLYIKKWRKHIFRQ